MEYIPFIFGLLAALSWLAAVVSWLLSLQHLAEGVTPLNMMFNGMKAFDPASFTIEGQKHQSRFLKAFAAFFLLVFITVGLSVAISQMQAG